MNLCVFFEGTGQGVSGNITNVSRLYGASESSEKQKLHLEAGRVRISARICAGCCTGTTGGLFSAAPGGGLRRISDLQSQK
jgi:hypothetical protein